MVSSCAKKITVGLASIVAILGFLCIFVPAIICSALKITDNLHLSWLAGIPGGGLFVGGFVVAVFVTKSEAVTWKSIVIIFVKGFLAGTISSFLSLVASAACNPVASHLEDQQLIVATVLGGLCVLVSNAFGNLIFGRNFNDGWKPALVAGLIIGFVCKGLQIGFDNPQAKTLGLFIKNTLLNYMDGGFRAIVISINWVQVASALRGIQANASVIRCICNAAANFTIFYHQQEIIGEVEDEFNNEDV